jgi:hypothetical protein
MMALPPASGLRGPIFSLLRSTRGWSCLRFIALPATLQKSRAADFLRERQRPFSPASGMWAATYTIPATDGSVPASVITAPQ